jgi:hypothetical protein
MATSLFEVQFSKWLGILDDCKCSQLRRYDVSILLSQENLFSG